LEIRFQVGYFLNKHGFSMKSRSQGISFIEFIFVEMNQCTGSNASVIKTWQYAASARAGLREANDKR